MHKDGPDSVARLCRQYVRFLESPDEDALFDWSNALHSMHDRVPAAMKKRLFESDEFVALKALRNHFHHGGEVAHKVKPLAVKGLPVVSDLGILCLIDRSAAEAAIAAINKDYREREQPMARRALKWYGPCVNLYPAIFNLMAKVVLLTQEHDIAPDDEAFKRLAAAVAQDQANGYPVTVTGDIGCHAGSVDQVLRTLMTMG